MRSEGGKPSLDIKGLPRERPKDRWRPDKWGNGDTREETREAKSDTVWEQEAGRPNGAVAAGGKTLEGQAIDFGLSPSR